MSLTKEIKDDYSLLQAKQSNYQRTLTVLERIKSFLCEEGLVPRGELTDILSFAPTFELHNSWNCALIGFIYLSFNFNWHVIYKNKELTHSLTKKPSCAKKKKGVWAPSITKMRKTKLRQVKHLLFFLYLLSLTSLHTSSPTFNYNETQSPCLE